MTSVTLQDSATAPDQDPTRRERPSPASRERASSSREAPRLGFLGTGWIGRNRMEAIQRSGAGQVVMICDPAEEMVSAAAASAPEARVASAFEELLEAGLDGIVIATPSALHAEQTIRALESGAAVFCQKPLGRTGAETARAVEAARLGNLLLEVDLSYRFTEGMRQIRELVRAGSIGQVYAADLVFHNAYGPGKDWFYDVNRSGGGCVMDLGIHLVDLALWTLGFPEVEGVQSRLFAGGHPLGDNPEMVEDYGTARLDLSNGSVVQVACSWRLHAGRDAHIAAAFYGTEGGLQLRNVNGSFYDFVAEAFTGTSSRTLASPPDEWGGRAAVAWAERLAGGARFDPAADRLVDVARVLDRIYGR